MRRTPLRRRSKRAVRAGREYTAARTAVADRSQGWCEIDRTNRTTPWTWYVPGCCTGRATEVHHRLRRSQGGSHDLGNLLHLCGPCHAYVHDHPEEAYAQGWLIRAGG